MRSWLERGDEGNRQRLQQAGSWLTAWEFKPLSPGSKDVDTMAFPLEPPPLGIGFPMAPPPFQPMSRATESRFPRKAGPDLMEDEGVTLAAGQRLGDFLDIDQIDDDTSYMGMDWSQLSQMGLDLYNLDAPFSPIPLSFDPDAAMKEHSSDRNK